MVSILNFNTSLYNNFSKKIQTILPYIFFLLLNYFYNINVNIL